MARSPLVDLTLLRTFVAVVEAGSISAAARRLHLTQGAVSQQLQRLENFFDCALLARDSRGTQLTARGNDLLARAHDLLQLNDSLCAAMLGAPSAQVVRVGVPYDMAGAHFAPILKTFAASHPQVQVSLVSGSSVQLLEDFAQGRVDLAISQCPIGLAHGERLAQEPLVWLSAAPEETWPRPLPLCFVTPTCTFRHTVFASLAQAGIEWRVVYENASVDATLSTVRSQLALTPWLRALVPDDLRVLGHSSGLPQLPDFAIELNVAAHAPAPVREMAEAIRRFYQARHAQ